jgi:hypothetical protein
MATSNNIESTIKQNQLYECKVFQCPRQRDKPQKNSTNSNHDGMIYGNVLHSDCNSLYLQTFNKCCATDKLKMFLNLTCQNLGAHHDSGT